MGEDVPGLIEGNSSIVNIFLKDEATTIEEVATIEDLMRIADAVGRRQDSTITRNDRDTAMFKCP